jgi:hypothetical protein
LRKAAYLAAIAVAGLSLTACSGSTPGNANPAPTTSPTGPSSGPSSSGSAVPQVATPLDVTKFEQSPCGVLTSTQAAQIANLTTSKLGDGATSLPICTWSDDNHNAVDFGFVHGDGLASAYQYQNSQSGYFQIAPDILGYPAVFTGPSDSRGKGICTMYVGVRNDEVMTVDSTFRTTSPSYADPCSATQKAAEAAMTTVKGGS